MNLKKMLYASSATLALVAPLALSGVIANADTIVPIKTTQTAQKDNGKAQRTDAPKLTNNPFYQKGFLKGSFFDNFVKASRLGGSNYNVDNKAYSTSVTATHNNSTLHYNVQTYNSDGTPSNKAFAIGISKNGRPYKVIKSTTGSLKGSLTVNKGTYTLQVLTPQAYSHFTGGLSLS